MADELSGRPLALRILGTGEDVQRLRKRLRCAAAALGVRLTVRVEGDDLHALRNGARRGPLLLAGERVIVDGLVPVELLQRRLAELLAEAACGGDAIVP